MKKRKSYLWPKLLGYATLIVILGQFILSQKPELAERLYGKTIFPFVRGSLDAIAIPISGIYLLLGMVLVYMGYQIYQFVTSEESRLRRFISLGCGLLQLLAILICWFYLSWGYNYNRPDLLERMNIQPMNPDTTWLFSELDQVIQDANDLRASTQLFYLSFLVPQDVTSVDFDIQRINKELESVLPKFNYDLKIDPPFRFMTPDGVLLHWSTAGIYWPFFGESNVDRGVHYIKKPVTISHELAHAHGLTSEGDCNFVAYLACSGSNDPLTRYSAQLSYMGYLMRDALKILGRSGLEKYYDKMSTEVRQDRENIYDHHSQYEDYFPKLRNKVYDSFLKSQGVKGGIESYNYFVMLKYNLID